MKITFRCPEELLGHLPKPIPAKRGMPDWYKKMPMNAFSPELGLDLKTLKQCTPFLDAMSYGFLIPLPVDVEVYNMEFSWDWDVPSPANAPGYTDIGLYSQAPVGFHYPAQAEGTPYFKEGEGFAKFNCFWTIQLEEGYSLYVTHPSNRYELPFRTINGLVDADTYNEVFLNFPALWVEPDFKGVLKKGTPVAQCIAIQRQAHELDIQAMNSEDAAKFLPLSKELAHGTNVYKNQFRVKKP